MFALQQNETPVIKQWCPVLMREYRRIPFNEKEKLWLLFVNRAVYDDTRPELRSSAVSWIVKRCEWRLWAVNGGDKPFWLASAEPRYGAGVGTYVEGLDRALLLTRRWSSNPWCPALWPRTYPAPVMQVQHMEMA